MPCTRIPISLPPFIYLSRIFTLKLKCMCVCAHIFTSTCVVLHVHIWQDVCMYVHVECMVCPVKGQYVVEVKHSLLKRCSQIFMATIFLHYIEEYFACDMFSRLPPGLLWCLFIYTKSNSLRKLCFKIFISSLQFCCLSLVMTSKYLNRKIMPRVNFVKRSPSSAFIDMMLCELVALSIFSDNFHIQKCQSWNCTRFQYCMKHISDKPEGYIVGVKNGKSKTTQSSHFNA